jgi:hypothetical protein
MNSHHFSSPFGQLQGLSKDPWDPWDRGRKCGDDVRSTVTLMPNLVHRSKGALAAIKKMLRWAAGCWFHQSYGNRFWLPKWILMDWKIWENMRTYGKIGEFTEILPWISSGMHAAYSRKFYKWVPTCSNKRRMVMFHPWRSVVSPEELDIF